MEIRVIADATQFVNFLGYAIGVQGDWVRLRKDDWGTGALPESVFSYLGETREIMVEPGVDDERPVFSFLIQEENTRRYLIHVDHQLPSGASVYPDATPSSDPINFLRVSNLPEETRWAVVDEHLLNGQADVVVGTWIAMLRMFTSEPVRTIAVLAKDQLALVKPQTRQHMLNRIERNLNTRLEALRDSYMEACRAVITEWHVPMNKVFAAEHALMVASGAAFAFVQLAPNKQPEHPDILAASSDLLQVMQTHIMINPDQPRIIWRSVNSSEYRPYARYEPASACWTLINR